MDHDYIEHAVLDCYRFLGIDPDAPHVNCRGLKQGGAGGDGRRPCRRQQRGQN
jgi:hypothetical protein